MLTPVGLLRGVPLVATYAAVIALGNAFPPLQAASVQYAAVAGSLGANALWVVLLATWIDRLTRRETTATEWRR